MIRTLANSYRSTHLPFCLGFDPAISRLHPFLKEEYQTCPSEDFILHWYLATLEPSLRITKTVKLQSAYFEALGTAGHQALREIIRHTKQKGIWTILDVKRGDISSTMAAYGASVFDDLDADAMTILPWMGLDVLTALEPWLKKGKGVYTVWLSSNPSGRQIQEQRVMGGTNSPGHTLATILFEIWEEWIAKNGCADQCGYVLGATDIPDGIETLLKRREHSLLMPGLGAQGGKIDQRLKSFIDQHPASLLPIARGLQPDSSETISSWDEFSECVSRKALHFEQQWHN